MSRTPGSALRRDARSSIRDNDPRDSHSYAGITLSARGKKRGRATVKGTVRSTVAYIRSNLTTANGLSTPFFFPPRTPPSLSLSYCFSRSRIRPASPSLPPRTTDGHGEATRGWHRRRRRPRRRRRRYRRRHRCTCDNSSSRRRYWRRGGVASKRQSRCDCDSRASPRRSPGWWARPVCCRRTRCCSSARVACSGTTASSVPPPGWWCCARRSACLGPAEMRSLRESANWKAGTGRISLFYQGRARGIDGDDDEQAHATASCRLPTHALEIEGEWFRRNS